MMGLSVYELFSSIQGESTRAGLPCFFIRLAGCNLRCTYCDTRKAWLSSAGKNYTVEELVTLAEESGIPLVEITGGEPLFQEGTPQLCRKLLDAGLSVMIETNGSLDVSVLPPEVIRIIDVKTPSSGECGKMLESNFRGLRPLDEVKFVISDRNDYEFARKRIAEYGLEKQTRNILFSPGFGTIETSELVKWILEDKVSARINLQIHKVIWGAEREGV